MPRPRASSRRATDNPNWRPVSVYLPHPLYAELDRRARESRRSLSAEITVLLEAQVAKNRAR